jgi:hypothetical protein
MIRPPVAGKRAVYRRPSACRSAIDGETAMLAIIIVPETA